MEHYKELLAKSGITGSSIVIKMGGSLVENKAAIESICNQLAFLKQNAFSPIIVHGAGPAINAMQKELGIETKFVDGLRYTDEQSIELVEKLLCGEVRMQILKALEKAGVQAIGLSGNDNKLFTTTKIKDKDLGFVGNVADVNTTAIEELIAADFLPVIGSIGPDENLQTLNVNADSAAGAIAGALKVKEFLLLTNVEGLIIDDQVVNNLTLNEAKELLVNPQITTGMIPKLTCCINALEQGVSKVKILGTKQENSILESVIADNTYGTLIRNEI